MTKVNITFVMLPLGYKTGSLERNGLLRTMPISLFASIKKKKQLTTRPIQ